MTSSALDGLRVVELSSGPATGLATLVLADFGADVIVIDPPAADPLRDLPAAPMWRRGKDVLTLDVHQHRDQFQQLLAAADVLVCNWRPATLVRHQLDYESLRQHHPHLLYCHVTGFGSDGPLADLPGYEHVAAALSGRMLGFSGIVDRDGPVFSALQVGIHACAQYALSGILAALHQQQASGCGQLIETSLLQGLLPYEQGAMLGLQFPDRFGDLYKATSAAEPPKPSLYYHPAQAADGRWMQFGNLLPHLYDNFLLVTDLMDVVADPDWNPTQLTLPQEKHEAFRERMLMQIQQRTAAEWMTDCIANGGVVATTYATTQEALQDPDIVANGHVIERMGGVQLGPLARLSDTPATPGREARSIASDRLKHWLATPRASHLPSAHNDQAVGDTRTLPLTGVKVVELATIIAAPMAASLLADMGAEVTKVEQVGGDPYRGLGRGVGSARVNAGKRSISVNLKTAEGRELVLKLLSDADILIHNYRPGVPERLGIGYEAVAAINPAIVYLQCNGYGPDGPSALRPSTHPIPGAAMGGVVYQMGGRMPTTRQDMTQLRLWTRRIMRANEVNPDPNTAMVVMSAALLGLNARQRTGRGQQIFVDMFGANAWANHDDFLDYPGKPPRAELDSAGYGLAALYRLYRCEGDSWIFLAAVKPREQERLAAALQQHTDSTINTAAVNANDDHLAGILADLFLTRPADAWQALFISEGIACVRADAAAPPVFWRQHSQAKALQLTQPAAHPDWGHYERHGAGVTFSGQQPPLYPPPLAGAHYRDILAALGYTDSEMDALRASGAIWQE